MKNQGGPSSGCQTSFHAAHSVANHSPAMTIAKTTMIWPINSLVGAMVLLRKGCLVLTG
jgi:hypothetical protein